jgi:hypothetical protein
MSAEIDSSISRGDFDYFKYFEHTKQISRISCSSVLSYLARKVFAIAIDILQAPFIFLRNYHVHSLLQSGDWHCAKKA